MNKWKLSFWVCFTLLVLSNAILIFGVFDQAVTITYMEQGFDDKIKANEVLGNLVVKGSNKYNQADFLHLLRQTYPNAFIVEEGNTISIGQNKFVFTNGKLTSAN